MDLLFSEFIEAFESVKPIKHQLFKNCNQMYLKECQKLIGCYNAGLERLKAIYHQEVLKIELINTKGRRAKEVT
ncbi:15165_t:CDS:2, partial [Funneliformis geosporum]